jgi:sporulation protein YlmC with PRC-barrel domain
LITYCRRVAGNLIGSDKVEGTAVYGPDGTKIGSIERVMIDKLNGKVSYAVLSFGGFLGIGDDYYPLPWRSLKYDTNLGGYVTGITAARRGRRATSSAKRCDVHRRSSRQAVDNCPPASRRGLHDGEGRSCLHHLSERHAAV